MQDMLVIDGLQYSNWSEALFRQMREGGLSAVHATIAYHETARETLSRIGEWNRRFEAWPGLIRPVRQASDITLAQREGRVGVFFGFQNCSPIEDDIDLVEVFRQLGVFVMQLTYNNQSLLASGCYESEDNGISRFGRQVIGEMNRVGMLIDMSHSAERSTLQAIELSARPVIISHANPSSFHPARRNKSDAVLRAIAQSGAAGLQHLSLPSARRPGLPPGRVLRHGGAHGGPDGRGPHRHRHRPVPAAAAAGVGMDAQRPLEQGQGLWRGSAANADWPAPLPWFRDSRDFPVIAAGLRERASSMMNCAGSWG